MVSLSSWKFSRNIENRLENCHKNEGVLIVQRSLNEVSLRHNCVLYFVGIFYLKVWVPNKPPVDKDNCTCSCFDTVFKGNYCFLLLQVVVYIQKHQYESWFRHSSQRQLLFVVSSGSFVVYLLTATSGIH